jgi:Tetratricopeptide repeat
MKRMLLALALFVGVADVSPARAQFGPVHSGLPVSRSGFSPAHGLGLPPQRQGFRVVVVAGGFPSRSVFVAPISPFAFGPGFIGPVWAWNNPNFWGSFAPPVVVVPPPIILAGGGSGGTGEPFRNGMAAAPPPQLPPPPRPDEEPRPLGAKPGDFFVIEPKKQVPPGRIVPEVDRVAVPMPPAANKFDPFAAPIPIKAEKREADPEKEAARLMKLGREALAAGEYGKAGEHFERATLANPKAAEPHFLKAQAAFAAGAYADAVTSIRAGLALDPTWPTSAFDPKEPYGLNAGAFTGHLVDLRKANVANPGEPALEFLLGYELWFIGEKVEAKKWFAAAEKGLDAPGPIALFK